MNASLFDHKNKDLTDILRGALASLAGFAGRIGARIIFLFFAGNFYGAGNLGRLAAVIAVIEILVTIGIFGFRRSLLEILQKSKGKPEEQYRAILSAITMSLLIGLVMGTGLAFLWDLIGLYYKGIFYSLFAFIIPVMAVMEVILTSIRYKRVIRYEVFARSLVEPWTIAITSVAFFFLGWVSFGLILAYVLSMFAVFLFAVWAFAKQYSWRKVFSAKLDIKFIKNIGKFSGPTAVVDVIGIAFRRVDVLFLGFFAPDTVVGIYYGVQQIATVLQKTRHVFDPMLQPVISQTLDHRGTAGAGQQLRQVCRWILTLLAMLLAQMAFYGGSLLGLVGEGFAVGALALTIVLAAEAMEGTFASAELPFVFKKPILNLCLTATAFAVHLVGLTFLTPLYGMIGTAMSFFIALFVLNAMRLVAIKMKFDIQLLHWGYLKPIAAGTISFLAVLYTSQFVDLKSGYMVPIGVILGLAVYWGMFWVFRPSSEDREFFSYLRAKRKPAKLVVDKDFDQV